MLPISKAVHRLFEWGGNVIWNSNWYIGSGVGPLRPKPRGVWGHAPPETTLIFQVFRGAFLAHLDTSGGACDQYQTIFNKHIIHTLQCMVIDM